MRTLVFTYRDIQWMLPIYDRLHKKYFETPYTLVAEEDYRKGGDFIKPPSPDHAGDFTEALRWTLNQITDEFVLVMFADHIITSQVNMVIIEQIIEYMSSNKTVLRTQIGDHSGLMQYGTKTETYKDLELYEHNFLPTSLTPGIWNRDLLIKFMQLLGGTTTPWGFEIRGRDAFSGSGYRSLGLNVEPMCYINSLRGRNNTSMVISQRTYEEVKDLIPPNVILPTEIVK